MEDLEAEKYLKEIKEAIAEGERLNLTPSEVYGLMDGILPVKTITIIKEPVSSPEKLAYMKQYREEQKKIQQQADEEAKRKARIDKALQRKNIYCFECRKNVPIGDPATNTYQIQEKKNRSKKYIEIFNFCPVCSTKCKGFGGYIS